MIMGWLGWNFRTMNHKMGKGIYVSLPKSKNYQIRCFFFLDLREKKHFFLHYHNLKHPRNAHLTKKKKKRNGEGSSSSSLEFSWSPGGCKAAFGFLNFLPKKKSVLLFSWYFIGILFQFPWNSIIFYQICDKCWFTVVWLH